MEKRAIDLKQWIFLYLGKYFDVPQIITQCVNYGLILPAVGATWNGL